MFACVYFHASHANKWGEVEEKKRGEEKRRKCTLLNKNEQTNRAVAAMSVPLFFAYV